MRYIVPVLLLLCCSMFAFSTPNYPFPQHMTYEGAISPSPYTQAQLDQNTLHYYQEWKKNYLVHEGNFYRIATDKKDKSRTVSEGQGYGMLISAYFAGADKDAQKIFDGLFRFSRAHPSSIVPELTTWQVPEVKGESDSAFDGDADIAYALLLADKQWGSNGEINYKKEALKIIDAIMKHTIGSKSHLPMLGDWVDPNGKQYNQYTTRSSDFMISHFRTFYAVTKDKRWLKVVHETQKALLQIQSLPHNKTKLVSDFLYYDKTKKHFFPTKKHFLEEEDDSYYYNACRVPWRVGVDALLYNNATSREISRKMLSWIYQNTQKNPQNIKSGYHLDGKVIGGYPSTAFITPFGVAAKSDPKMQHYLDALYDFVKNRQQNYYEDSINLLSLLIITNNYWDPATVKTVK